MSRLLKMELLLWAFGSPDHQLLSGSGWGKADENVRSDSLSGGICSPGLCQARSSHHGGIGMNSE